MLSYLSLINIYKMKSIELNPKAEFGNEIYFEEVEKLSVNDAIDNVIASGLYAAQLEQGRAEELRGLLPTAYDVGEKDQYGWILKQGDDFKEEDLNRFWNCLAPDFPNFKIIRPVINHFRPNDYIPKHQDFNMGPGKKIEIGGENGLIESALTFLYTVEGEKDILLYTNGQHNEPIIIRQIPGQLLVFPVADIANIKGDLLVPGLFHEVPKQDTSCNTFVWELKRLPIPPRY